MIRPPAPPVERHDPEERFIHFLFRPYFDFGPADLRAPHHVVGLHFAVRSLIQGRDHPHLQASMNPSFRTLLLRTAGVTGEGMADLFAANADSEEVRRIAACHRDAARLDLIDRRRLAWVLIKAGLHRDAEVLLSCTAFDAGASPEAADIAFALAYARYRQFVDDPALPYSAAEFAAIADRAPPGMALIDATYQLTVQAIKHRADADEAARWLDRQWLAIERSDGVLNAFSQLFVRSRFHRVGGFIPQIRNEPDALRTQMDAAQRYAEAITVDDPVWQVAADEVLFPVLESRTREAMALGELELAADRASALVDLSPSDARGWLLLGEVAVARGIIEEALRAYGRAQWFAPPGREIALFMRGQCFEQLQDTESACRAYLEAVIADPLGIAAVEALVILSARMNNALLEQWATDRRAELCARRNRMPTRQAWPYKALPPVGGAA